VRWLALVLIAITASTASARTWECVEDARSKCYVSYVRFFPNGRPYVKAKLHDPEDTTTCEYVRVRVGEGTDDLDTVRAINALLVTALTSGMPIRFLCIEEHGDERDCYAAGVVLSLPGE